LAELEELDPKGVKRARSYMAFGLLARTGSKKKPAKKTDEKADKTADLTATAAKESLAKKPTADLAAKIPTTKAPTADVPTADVLTKKPVPPKPAIDAVADSETPPGPSRMMIIGGPLIAGLVLFGVFALLLRGADVRSSSPENRDS